jgi:hypothetical protein
LTTHGCKDWAKAGRGEIIEVVQVSVVYFPGCPNWRQAAEATRQALDVLGHTATPVNLIPVQTEAEAAGTGFGGSPTIVVDGRDLFATGARHNGLTCRIYPTATGGLAPVPSVADLVAALRDRTTS